MVLGVDGEVQRVEGGEERDEDGENVLLLVNGSSRYSFGISMLRAQRRQVSEASVYATTLVVRFGL